MLMNADFIIRSENWDKTAELQPGPNYNSTLQLS